MVFDFSFFLVLAALVTGLVWFVDARFFRPGRLARSGSAAGGAPEPVVVEYARSFFPIILLVLVIRSFL
ncbi:MAG: signal peptidase I, partial [Steroidobacteraceae bacterium]